MMLIEARRKILFDGQRHRRGEIVAVPIRVGRFLIHAKLARPFIVLPS
jgi:hypothetical protein